MRRAGSIPSLRSQPTDRPAGSCSAPCLHRSVCSGRVDLRQVEVTIQNLIGSGMDPKTENNPYLGFIYTSFQVGSGS